LYLKGTEEIQSRKQRGIKWLGKKATTTKQYCVCLVCRDGNKLVGMGRRKRGGPFRID